MDEKQELNELLNRILEGRATANDLQRYMSWCERFQVSPKEISKSTLTRIERKMYEQIRSQAEGLPPGRIKTRRTEWGWYAAASVAIFCGLLLGMLTQDGAQPTEVSVTTESPDVEPGGNRAILQLGDGSLVSLSADQPGIVMESEKVAYANGETVSSKPAHSSPYVLTTPKGGQYQVTLPDGSKAWLNAATTLTYPAQFSDSVRMVELDGEAFFEVQKLVRGNRRVPFLVKTKGQTVEVLGTTFNISAYAGETTTRTTLVSGAVLVTDLRSNAMQRLSPKMQSIVGEAGIHVEEVDVMSQIAWKNGLFVFNDTPLAEAMNQLSRWYDVEIVYHKNVPQAFFFGVITRDTKLSAVLNILKEGGVNFEIVSAGTTNKLMVLP